MPFMQKPEGFGSESLGLLDDAMTKLGLQQVLIGACLSGANPAVQPSLHDKVRRLHELGMRRRRQPRNRMSAHTFKLGQDVTYHPAKGSLSGPSRYRVLKLLPREGGKRK